MAHTRGRMVATNAKGIQLGANYLKESNRIALIGNGGNLAIAQHMASDIYRHTNKFCFTIEFPIQMFKFNVYNS